MAVVDWEWAIPDGVPGFDAVHVAVASLEHGVGLTRWSDDDVASAFRAAWLGSGLFEGARAAVVSTAAAAGVGPSDVSAETLWVAYFARRLGRKLEGSGPHGLGVAALVSMLETVVDS